MAVDIVTHIDVATKSTKSKSTRNMSNDPPHTSTHPRKPIAYTDTCHGRSIAGYIRAGLLDPRKAEVSNWLKDDSQYLPQAGGHQIMSQSSDRSIVYKPTNDTEKHFYKTVAKDPSLKELSPFLPDYYGSTTRWKTPAGEWMHASPTQTSSKTDNIDKQIILENLYSDFSNPSIVDFKMGDSLADPDSEAGMRQRSKARIKPLKSTLAPVRLAGCELYSYNTDGSATIQLKLGKKHRILFSSHDHGKNGGFSLDDTLAAIFPGPMDQWSEKSQKFRDTLAGSADATTIERDRLSTGGLDETLKGYDRSLAVLSSIRDQTVRLKTALKDTEWRFPGASACWGFGPLTAEKVGSLAQSEGSDPNIDVIDGDWGVRVSFIDTAYAHPTPGQGGDPGLEKAFDEKIKGLQRRIEHLKELKEEEQVARLQWRATAVTSSRDKSLVPPTSCSLQSRSIVQDDSFRTKRSEVMNVC